jgi:FAD/FMN-containing dehydrogenase
MISLEGMFILDRSSFSFANHSRSSGPDSLSIYTHKLRGIEIVDELDSSSATKPAALVKIHAGERMHEIVKFAAGNKLTPIGGADPHVGIGGWISGGGHGPLTGKYGMGADQVVEMQVVTADGVLRTVNADCEPDLFWALRGVRIPCLRNEIGRANIWRSLAAVHSP